MVCVDKKSPTRAWRVNEKKAEGKNIKDKSENTKGKEIWVNWLN